MIKQTAYPDQAHQSGFSLVELMIALLLSLMVFGAVVLVFIANGDSYRFNENLSRAQESGRYALTRMSRSIREAGGLACGSNIPVANVITNAAANWWSNWGTGIEGIEDDIDTFPRAFGAGGGERVAGTDAIILHSGTEQSVTGIKTHNSGASELTINNNSSKLVPGDIVVGCDFRQAAIFQLSFASAGSDILEYTPSGSVSPGNCTQNLSAPALCPNPNALYTFSSGGTVAKLTSTAWYIGHNALGTQSLYRLILATDSNQSIERLEEIVDDVTDLQIQYLEKNAAGMLVDQYVDADAVMDWNKVVSVRLVVSQETAQTVTTDNDKLEIKWHAVVSLRNRSI